MHCSICEILPQDGCVTVLDEGEGVRSGEEIRWDGYGVNSLPTH